MMTVSPRSANVTDVREGGLQFRVFTTRATHSPAAFIGVRKRGSHLIPQSTPKFNLTDSRERVRLRPGVFGRTSAWRRIVAPRADSIEEHWSRCVATEDDPR